MLCLNEIGIRVKPQLASFDKLAKRYLGNTEFQAVLTEIQGVFRNPENLLTTWSSDVRDKSKGGGFEHPEVTRLIKNCFDEKDPKKQKELFFAIDALITSLQPGTFLFHKTAFDVMSKRFLLPHRFSLTHEGIHRLRYATLKHQ